MNDGAESITRDRYALYERAAQSPARQARFLRALHQAPRAQALTLGEDFSAAGAISRAWIDAFPGSAAICIDIDPEPLERLRALAGDCDALAIHQSDVLDRADPVDLIAVLNFSICEIRSREDLLRYLRHARARLKDHGLLVLDLYGGADAFILGESEEELRDDVTYVWEQREANPMTGEVVNAMHFILPSGERLEDAFVYHWRLWSLPELTDALVEAGFTTVEIYDRLGSAIDDEGNVHALPIADPDELDENYVVYIAARTE